VPQIEVTFDIDANGIVHVSAKDKATNKEQSIRIQSSGGLTEDQIQQMVRDAESYSEKDKERKELIEARNEADSLVYSTEKSVQEHKARLPQNVIDDINAAIAEVKEKQGQEDLSGLKEANSKLMTAAMKIGEALAQQSGGGSDTGSSGGSSGSSGTSQ
jgi:molecular chaperone DnaK (HSP70)